MRKKVMKLVVTFHTTSDAMAMEKVCKERGVPGRLIPVPRAISAGCGLSWLCNKEDREKNAQGVYELKNRQILKNKNVLLFDDIYTTGNTANSCCGEIKKAEPNNIGVLVLAKD